MTASIIDFSAYRRPPVMSLPPAPQEAFVAQYARLDGYVFGTIDAEGRRTFLEIGLSLAEAISLFEDHIAAKEQSPA